MLKKSKDSNSSIPFEVDKFNEGQIVAVTWNKTCNNLLDEKYRQLMEELNKDLKKLNPEKLLVDLQHCQYVVTAGVLKWYDHTLSSLFGESEPDYLAFVVPSNLFNHIFFEAAETAEKMKNTKVNYFRKREQALEWLKKN